jgi:anti-anti-sigma regulatory factor
MALFNKPPAKKPEVVKPQSNPAPKPAAAQRAPVSARDVAQQAQGRRGAPERPRAEPVQEMSMTGASLIEWSPGRAGAIEVGQSNPGLCAVLENAALLYASGQAKPARELLEQGVQNDADAKNSPLAWLALFDLLQRANDRTSFDRMSLLYVVQFERSPPAWDETGAQPQAAAVPPKATGGGYAVLTGKLTEATAPQIEALRKTLAKGGMQTRFDLSQVAGFDDAGARLLAAVLAEARKRGSALKLERPEKLRKALDIIVRRGRDAGEGPWLLALEFLQFDRNQDAFDERAIEYAIAFEQSPPSWEPPPAPKAEAQALADTGDADGEAESAQDAAAGEAVMWTGVMSGPSGPAMGRIGEHAFHRPVVLLDMTAVERVDFVCAGALLNTINRVESQRKAVQIVGASPIIRALLLLIGISPRHFLKKLQ